MSVVRVIRGESCREKAYVPADGGTAGMKGVAVLAATRAVSFGLFRFRVFRALAVEP